MNKIDFPQKPIFLCYVGYTFLIWHRITLSNLHEIRQNIIALKEGKLYFDSGSLENFLARSVPSLIHHQKIEKILICWWPNSFAIDLWSYMYKIQCVPLVILEFLVWYNSYFAIKNIINSYTITSWTPCKMFRKSEVKVILILLQWSLSGAFLMTPLSFSLYINTGSQNWWGSLRK